MKPTKEQIEAYKAMAKEGAVASMEAQIRENLEKTCDKFAGNEDKFDRCIKYLNDCACEILANRNGDVPDEVCYRICRDYFNDEIWKKEDEEEAEREKKRAEMNANAKYKKKANPTQKKPVPEKKKPEPAKKFKVCPECGKEFINLFKGVCLECYDKMRKAEDAKRKAEAIKKTPEEIVADKNRALIAENNKKLDIRMAQPIDMFAEAV